MKRSTTLNAVTATGRISFEHRHEPSDACRVHFPTGSMVCFWHWSRIGLRLKRSKPAANFGDRWVGRNASAARDGAGGGIRTHAVPGWKPCAFPGQLGFVGGTMGEQSVILEGVENEHARYSLYSTVHGAGRAMGRREATGVVDRKTGEVKRAGKVTSEMMRAWVDRTGIELRGAGLDESPDCYKRLDEVLESVGDTVRILHRLTPVGVAMAGANEFDPYKD
jgi:tRNA-splicing ligase RtcB